MGISFNRIPANIRVPLFYAEIDNSAANTAMSEGASMLVGQMLNTGTAEIGVPVLVASASRAKTLFGRGSVLARMVESFRNVDTMTELWCIPVAEPAGAQASGTITVSGTATGAGTLSLYVGGARLQIAVEANAVASAVATAINDAINTAHDLPVTATAVANTVTLTAKNIGAIGNDIAVVFNRNGATSGEAFPEGVSAVVAPMAGGTGAPDVAPAFAAMGDEAFDYIGMPYTDATNLNAVAVAMGDDSGRWAYTRQLYGHVYTAARGTAQELIAIGTTRNDQHCTIFGVEPAHPDGLPEIVGAALARQAVYLNADTARPTQTGVLTGIGMPAIQNRFVMTERNTLLKKGIATLYYQGYCRIERAITTYQSNAFGDTDNSYLDSETLHTLAYVTRYLRRTITSKYARHKLANDGTRYASGQAVVTPKTIRGEIIAAYRELEYNAIVENGDIFAKHLIVERDSLDPNRVNVLFPPDLVNQLRVFAVLNQFRLQYGEE